MVDCPASHGIFLGGNNLHSMSMFRHGSHAVGSDAQISGLAMAEEYSLNEP